MGSLLVMLLGVVISLVGYVMLVIEIQRMDKNRNDKIHQIHRALINRYMGKKEYLKLDFWTEGLNLSFKLLKAASWKNWIPFIIIFLGTFGFVYGIFLF